MDDAQVAPFGLEIFEDETAVAMIGTGFTTEQHDWHGKEARADTLFDLALGHQRQKASLVVLPASLALPVGVEHDLCGREQWLVDVLGAAELAEEVCQIIALGEAGELRRIVQANI